MLPDVIAHAEKRRLRRELESAGAFEPRPLATSLKFLLLLASIGALVAAAVLGPSWAVFVVTPLAAILATTAAMIGHEAAHGSFSRSKRQNNLMLHVAFPLFTGLGATHWKNKHNRLHHSHPNVPGQDQDIALWPFAASAADHARSGPFRRWMQRSAQAYMFWPLTLLLGFSMRLDSVKHVVRRVRRNGLERDSALDAACMTAHYALWLVLPSLVFGPLPTILFYVALWGIVGLLLSMVFAPAHMGLPFVRGHEDKWLHQLETTRNLRMPRWMSWMVVGLDHQVEHHLLDRKSVV